MILTSPGNLEAKLTIKIHFLHVVLNENEAKLVFVNFTVRLSPTTWCQWNHEIRAFLKYFQLLLNFATVFLRIVSVFAHKIMKTFMFRFKANYFFLSLIFASVTARFFSKRNP